MKIPCRALTAVILASCAASLGAAPTHGAAASDADVMGACIDSVAPVILREVDTQGAQPPVLIMPMSRKTDGYLTSEQVREDLEPGDWETVATLLADSRMRSAISVRLSSPHGRTPTRFLTDDDMTREAKALWVEFYRPGYDDKRAFVRGLFWPTYHGGSFSCLVTHEGVRWVTAWSRAGRYN